MSRSQWELMINELEHMGEERARQKIIEGSFGTSGSERRRTAEAWLEFKTGERKWALETEELVLTREANSLARDAKSIARRATRLSVVAIIISLLALLAPFHKQILNLVSLWLT